MSIEDILEALDEQCRDECREIFERAQTEAKEILEKARVEADEIREARLEKVKAEAESDTVSMLYSARLKSKNAVIGAKEEIAEEALEKAAGRLNDLRSGEDYPTILEDYLKEGLEPFDGKVIVHVDPRDRELAQRLMRGIGRDCEIRTDIETLGGAIVSDEGGQVLIFNTVEERLNRAKERLRLQVYEILFGEDEKAEAGGG